MVERGTVQRGPLTSWQSVCRIGGWPRSRWPPARRPRLDQPINPSADDAISCARRADRIAGRLRSDRWIGGDEARSPHPRRPGRPSPARLRRPRLMRVRGRPRWHRPGRSSANDSSRPPACPPVRQLSARIGAVRTITATAQPWGVAHNAQVPLQRRAGARAARRLPYPAWRGAPRGRRDLHTPGFRSTRTLGSVHRPRGVSGAKRVFELERGDVVLITTSSGNSPAQNMLAVAVEQRAAADVRAAGPSQETRTPGVDGHGTPPAVRLHSTRS